MRVTLLNHRYAPFHGGSERYIQKMAEWLLGRSWDVRVITTNAFDLEYFWDAGKRAVDAPERERVNGVEVVRLPVRHPAGSALRFQAGRRGMGEASRVVRQHQPFGYLSQASPEIPKLDRQLMAGPQSDVVVGANLGLESLAIAGAREAQRTGSKFVLLPFTHLGSQGDVVARRYVSMPHQIRLVRQADLIVALTHVEAQMLEELGASPHRIIVAGAGVEEPLPKLNEIAQSNRSNRRFTIISIGAMASDKGTPDLVRASISLKKRGICHRLVLIGPEMSAFADWFRRSGAVDCKWIEHKGVVSEQEKERLMQESDVLALTSRTESFGIVYLEAWTHRLPVVAADSGAVPEVVADGQDGVLVPFGNPGALADALEALVADPRRACMLGAAGYTKVQDRYLWRHVFERIQAGFERVLGIEVLEA